MSTFENCQPENNTPVAVCQPKPVRCVCGGEAQVFFPFTNNSVYMIECKKYGICTNAYETEVEAITAWNRAMSGNETGVRPPRMAE